MRKVISVIVPAFVVWVLFVASAAAIPSAHRFEIVPESFHFTTSTSQAGAHADWSIGFDFAHNAAGQSYNDVRTVITELPVGFIGNNTAVPTCTPAQLIGNGSPGEAGITECSPASQVGTISFNLSATASNERVMVPLYNMEVTSFGVTAELGFNVAGLIIQELEATVRPGDSGITVTTPDIDRLGEPRDVTVTVWGLPAAHEHDAQRGLECYSSHGEPCVGGGESANIPVRPFLSNPTSCGPHVARMEAYSWEESGMAPQKAETQVPAITECERVPFSPEVDVAPTTRSAESPSGLDVSLVVPQSWENPYSIETSNLDDSTVVLPVGYTANPSLASGLGTCTPQQLEAETSFSAPGAGCPPESKIGVVSVETPVLSEKLTGNIYIATPFDNKFDSLLGLYIVVKDPARGIIVKLQGHIEPNPVTGQLVTTFDESPQVPFSRFTLELDQDQTSPLVSPPVCGFYTTQAGLTPWSAPLAPPQLVQSAFQIETGISGSTCPSSGVPPFHPALVAGTLNNSAGSYTPMDIQITRQDGEQEITGFSTQLPPGLTANLTGVPFCSEADIALARTKTGGEEEAEPACPAASEIGHTLVGAGVGTVLAYTPGKVYLAGPFEGAPFSVAAITSAKVGPFDLGTVVVHLPLFINPETAAVSIPAGAANQIPHIVDGIVIHVRDIRVYVERSDFMINPTNCNPLTFSSAVIGGGQDPTNPADNTPATTNDPFQLANCQNLQFKPGFEVTTNGKTSKASGASLNVKLTYPVAPQGTQANIKRVKVDLPKQLPARLTTLQKACTEKEFDTNPASCPPASVIGHATAVTPILPVPLTGPAYFVSRGGAKFPELIMVLQGYGVTIVLHGETFISKQGITSSTFAAVPDQPVTSFELTLPQGQNSALAANGDLCTSKLMMPTEFVGQNGMGIRGLSTPVSVTGCAKTKALTRAQQLAKALNACNKKPKSKRAACRKEARKRYGPVSPDKKSRKKTRR